MCDHNSILYVVSVVSNPVPFQRRYELFNEFCERMRKEPNVRLFTIELQQRNRPFRTDANLQFHTNDELWHKENLINIAIQHLPRDWLYVAWIDADIEFVNSNWVDDTINQLQNYKIVQLFSQAIDLGPSKETLTVHSGFCYMYVNDEPMSNYRKNSNYRNGHVGYAYACRKDAYNEMGGLLDFCILGSADSHMALAWIGKVDLSLHKDLHENYKTLCKIYQERCLKHIDGNISYVRGTILHYFHGDKQDRQYTSRWQILIDSQYNPLRDIKRDNNGIYQLEIFNTTLRDGIKKYFRARNEDSKCLNQDYNYTKKKHI